MRLAVVTMVLLGVQLSVARAAPSDGIVNVTASETTYRYAIHGTLPKYLFTLKWSHDRPVEIAIATERSPTRIQQHIPVPGTNLGAPGDHERPSVLETADYNFDGYEDLRLESSSGTGVTFWDIWLFDGAKKQFVHSPLLSNLPSPMPDAKQHWIETSSIDGGGAYFSKSYFRWRNKSVHVVRIEDADRRQDQGRRSDPAYRPRTPTRRGLHGRLRR